MSVWAHSAEGVGSGASPGYSLHAGRVSKHLKLEARNGLVYLVQHLSLLIETLGFNHKVSTLITLSYPHYISSLLTPA